MANRQLIRFSLTSLLGLITLAAATLGYTKWSVDRSQHQLDELKAEGVMISVRSRETSWLEFLATGKKDLRSAYTVALSVRIFDDGYLVGDRFSGKHLSKQEMLPKFKELADRISALEAPNCYIRVIGDHRDENLERELKTLTTVQVEWLPPAIPEYGEF